MKLHITIHATRPDEGWFDEDMDALREDLEDEMRFYGDPNAVIEIEKA